MAISKERFREALDMFYSRETLFKLYNRYFLDWIAEGYIGSNLGLFEVSLISENSNKQTFLDLMEQMFSKEEVFSTIFETLPEEVRKIFVHLAWEGRYNLTDREEYLSKEESGYNVYRGLKDDYLFFKVGENGKKEGYLHLHNDIVRMLRKLLPKPKDYYINASRGKNYAYSKNNEKEVVEKFALYYNFYSQGNLSLSSSNKILKESKRNMYKYCSIAEYYKDSKDLDYLKTETLGLFFFLVKDEYLIPETFRLDNYKDTVNKLLSGELIKDDGYHYTSLYLNYLKGLRNIWKNGENIKRCLESIRKVLMELPDEGMVGVDNIIKYLIYRDEFLEIINPQDVYDYIYINEANYGRTRIGNYDSYYGYITEPFVKSILFLLGTLGVVEVYYDTPCASEGLYLKNGYLSKYDGLKYVGLTDLGKYILGRLDTYDFGDDKEEAEIYLDEDRPILSIIGDAPIKSMLLERMANRIGPNKFKFTREAFLKDVEELEKLEEKIAEFRKIVGSPLPEYWEDFFGELQNKAEAIERVRDIVVLQLSQDRELINIIGKSEELKGLILKAEGFYILVREENKERVVEILKKYGYFVSL